MSNHMKEPDSGKVQKCTSKIRLCIPPTCHGPYLPPISHGPPGNSVFSRMRGSSADPVHRASRPEAFRLIVYITALAIHSIRSLNSPYSPAARRDRSLRTDKNAQMASHALFRIQTGPAQGNGISRLTAFRIRRALCRRHLCHADGLMPAVRA